MTNKNFVLAKIYILITSVVLLALFFVPCNPSREGQLVALSSLITQSPFSSFWDEIGVPYVYYAVTIFSLVVVLTGVLLLLIKSPKVFRLMAFAVFTVAAMLYAFGLGSTLNAIGNATILYSYSFFAMILSAIAAIFGVRVTIYEKSDMEKSTETKEEQNI